MNTTDVWQSANLQLNRLAHQLAQEEFHTTNGRTPETLEELKTVWQRQSVILSQLKEQ
jgi:hypothetical protein